MDLRDPLMRSISHAFDAVPAVFTQSAKIIPRRLLDWLFCPCPTNL